MRFSVNMNRWIKLFFCLLYLLAPTGVWASGDALIIKNTDITKKDDSLWLQADADFRFDHTIEEAINKGISITFLYEFQIVQPRKYWFDDEIVTIRKSANISYYALTKQYLIHTDNHQESVDSLGEVKQILGHIRDWKIGGAKLLNVDDTYIATLRIHLDKSKLPKALQVEAIGEDRWDLSSNNFSWSLKNVN